MIFLFLTEPLMLLFFSQELALHLEVSQPLNNPIADCKEKFCEINLPVLSLRVSILSIFIQNQYIASYIIIAPRNTLKYGQLKVP
jgi:hypothetical protein